MEVYLDHASTRPLSQDTKDYIISLLDNYGNPSSLHSVGKRMKAILADSRNAVANFINASPESIYFTSGGSASNTLAIRGYAERNNCTVLYSPIAHKSILKCVKNFKSVALKVDKNGFLDMREFDRDCLMHRRSLVVIDYANSEIGCIQDVKQLIDTAHFYGCCVYLDCTGSIPTIPLDVAALDVDMCGFSAHKLGGLKGCGVLYKKPEVKIAPLVYGSQEQGIVGGTENTIGIATLGHIVSGYDYSSVSPANRDYVFDYINRNIPDAYLVGSIDKRLANNLYVCFKGIDGESLVYVLDMNGIYVSTGSACNSGDFENSSALTAIRFDDDDIRSCIRMTFSGEETQEELDYVCLKLKECVEQYRNLTL